MATSLEKRQVQDIVNLVLAILLFLSPWALGFAGETRPAWNAWIIGVVLAGFAIAALTAFAEWEEWIAGALGIWLIIAPWALGFSGIAYATWAHVMLGVLALAASAWAVWDYRHRSHAHA